MRFAALALLVSVACDAAPRVYDRACDVASRRSSRGGVACSTVDGGSPPAYTLCDQMTSGMKSGAWSCVNGDITSPAASTLAFTGVNSPVATVGSTCAAPSYQTFANDATDSHVVSTATMATPAGDFTACILFTPSITTGNTYVLLGHYPDISPYVFTQENNNAYFSAGDEKSVAIVGITQDVKTLLCFQWNAGTKVGSYYINLGAGSSVASAAANSSALTATSQLLRFGAESTSRNLAGRFFGGFLTHQVVPQLTLDAFFAATVTCP